MNKEKIYIKTEIFSKQHDSRLLWKDIKHIDFQDNDEIESQYVESYYSENESYDAHFITIISRKILETDEQQAKRISVTEKNIAELKERRYQTYLKLKKEFDV